MIGSTTFTMKAIFALLLLQLEVCQSGCCSPNNRLCYPRSGRVEGCIPPCRFHIPTASKATFETLCSTGFVRIIYFDVSFYNRHGSKMEESNHSYAWVRNDQEPFPLLPDKVEAISLGTMKKEAMKLPLVYNSLTCEQNSRCRDASLLWFLVENITQEAGTVLHTLEDQAILRSCVVKASNGTLDCSIEYKIYFFFDSVLFIIRVFALLCAVYLCPLIIVHWNSRRTNQGDDHRLMKLDSSYPVALYQLLLHLPSPRPNTWAARSTALLFFYLIIPSLVYVQVFLLYSGKMGFKKEHEDLFYGLAWKWPTSKRDVLPLISRKSESSSDYSPLSWHAVLTICCYFIMAVGISVLPKNAMQKNIPCPVCTLKGTERSLSREIWHHMHMHGIVIQKLTTMIKMVWNILTKTISQPSSHVLVWGLRASCCAFFMVPMILILVVMSFVALIVAVVLLSPLCTVTFYLLLHSWILILGIFKSRQIAVKPVVLSGSLCLVTVIVLFGCLGLLWILILTFSFPSKVLFFTLMGLILNYEQTGPYLAFGSVFAFNANSHYLHGIEEYRKVKLILFEVCLEEIGARHPEEEQTLEEIISYTDEGVPQIPKLYWLVSDKVLPLPGHIFNTILRILVVCVLTYLVFAFVMAFGGVTGLGNLWKSAAALLAGFLSRFWNIFANDDSGVQLEKLQLEKKIEKLVLLYCSVKVNKKKGKNNSQNVHQHTTVV